ncbi:MAG: hypothetical protein UW85_C0018G0007 [Parcubacteria group bacterium GW2011_GWA1_Parcubacteria_45_10]|nr:MAG: hypothetical protein UW85_C0018G0007 [Parcubacteria group bacterium GW2011_GWA1_Parcubacteria_45_10]
MKSGPTIGRTAVCGLALASAEVTRFGVVPRDFLVTDVAGGGVVDDACRHLFDLRAQLAGGAVLPLVIDSEELMTRDEEHFLFESRHVATSYCPKYYHNKQNMSNGGP